MAVKNRKGIDTLSIRSDIAGPWFHKTPAMLAGKPGAVQKLG